MSTEGVLSRFRWRLPLLVLLAAQAGCGSTGDRPPLAEVEGRITLDGQPVDRVLVRFEQEGFRASQAVTDAEGRYRLRYIRNIMGAAVGDHAVTLRDNTKKRRVPNHYANEPMSRTVESGRNEIDFELSSAK